MATGGQIPIEKHYRSYVKIPGAESTGGGDAAIPYLAARLILVSMWFGINSLECMPIFSRLTLELCHGQESDGPGLMVYICIHM